MTDQPRTPPDDRHDPRAAAGAVPTIAELVAEFHQSLYAYAYRLCGSAADAEDLVQQTFLIAQQKRAQIREAGSARAWLYTVLRNGFLKDRARRRPVNESLLEMPLDEVPGSGTSESAIDEERLHQALGELPDDYRVVIAMFYFEELSYKEIAGQLEIPVGTVMSRLSRAKQHLRVRLGSEAELKTR